MSDDFLCPGVRGRYYILNDYDHVVPASFEGRQAWLVMDEQSGQLRHQVKRTVCLGGNVVTTRFTGMDLSFKNEGPPTVWESMLFIDEFGTDCEILQCAGTRADAEAMHEQAVLKQGGPEEEF